MSLEPGENGRARCIATQPGCDDVKVVFEGCMRAQFTTAKASVCLLDTATFGELLLMDGEVQSSQADEGLYHEALVWPAMRCRHWSNEKANVLILGGGEGCVARDVLRWDVNSITQYDHDEEFVRWARHGLVHWNRGAYSDERVRVYTEDADAALRNGGKYDAVFVDIFDPRESSLDWFCEMLLGCVGKLNKGGVMAAYIGDAPRTERDIAVKIVRRLRDGLKGQGWVLPYRVYIPSFYGEACFVLVSLHGMPVPTDEHEGTQARETNQNAPQFMDEVSWVRSCTWGLTPCELFNKLSEEYVSYLTHEY